MYKRQISIFAQPKTMVSGKVISKEKQEVVDFATVYLKGTTYGCTTNEEGIYHLHAPAGKYTLVVSAIGYKTIEKPVTLVHGERIRMNVMIAPSVTELEEVVVVSNGVSRVKRSAFNAIAVDTKEFQNSTKNLSDALAKAPGMKLRESGGVGSDMQLMLDLSLIHIYMNGKTLDLSCRKTEYETGGKEKRKGECRATITSNEAALYLSLIHILVGKMCN